MTLQPIQDRYYDLLKRYIAGLGEESLLAAEDIGREMVFSEIPPEEVAEIHDESLRRLAHEYPDTMLLDTVGVSSSLQMGMLMAYGMAFREQVERRRLEDQLRRRDAILAAVNSMAAQLLGAETWSDSVQQGLSQLGKSTGVSRVYVFQANTDWRENPSVVKCFEWLAPGAPEIVDRLDIGQALQESEVLSEWVDTLRRGQPVVCSSCEIPEDGGLELPSLGSRSLVIVPLYVDGVLWGVLGLDDFAQEWDWEEVEIEALQTAAGLLGSVFYRINLREQRESQIQRLSALHRIDQAISSSIDLRLTLNILLDQLIANLQVDAANILLFSPPTNRLEYAHKKGFDTGALRHTKLRLGDGFAGRAALERQTVHIPNLSESPGGFDETQLVGTEGFVSYFAVPLIAKGELMGVLEMFHRAEFDPDSEWLLFMNTLANQAAIAIDNLRLFNNLQTANMEIIRAYDKTLEGWGLALALKDDETETHTLRVTDVTVKLAQALGLKEEELLHIRRGALLHDIGKIGVPDSILLKDGPLTEDEWELMKRHPILANEFLSEIDYLKAAKDIPYCHHEKWDGTGYPQGLKGQQIPLAARIFAVVDVWDALLSDRPYRKAWSEERVRQHLLDQAGKHFDPEVVKVFLSEVWQRD